MTSETTGDRFVVGDGITGWWFEYANREAQRRDLAISPGIEISVQLDGESIQHSTRTARRVYGPGSIMTLGNGERYACSFGGGGRGAIFGLLVYPSEVEEYRTLDGELGFPAAGALDDPRFVAFCADAYRSARRGAPPDPATLRSAVRDFIARHAELAPLDPLLHAKHELDRNFAAPLYMPTFAEIAGMHPETFTRKFRQRFGLPPARYRLLLRLNEAARRAWSRPDLTIGAIAYDVGIEDESFFYREFQKHFGKTPAQYGRRTDERRAA